MPQRIAARSHTIWLAFTLDRLPRLAPSLPLHLALLFPTPNGAAASDAALGFSEMFTFTLTKLNLVPLLAVHMFGGLR